ncbi:site-specific integrase [Lacticaseibacillus pantheris]
MTRTKTTQLFYHYFEDWVQLYKVNSVRPVTLNKYYVTLTSLVRLAPKLRLCDLTRQSYQQLINAYAQNHERQTTMDFHHQLKSCLIDAFDEGKITQNPTRKAVITGKQPGPKKTKFLSQFEAQQLIHQMNLGTSLNWDWFLFLILKTGLRFSEALAITPECFDFTNQKLSVKNSWDYRHTYGGFMPTKNSSSVRKIQLDWQITMQFSQLVRELPADEPIFVHGRVFNASINRHLKRLCESAKVPVLSIHGLRHTHASLLLFAGVSVASVARRLGHANMATTQSTYLHIIQELESKDGERIMREMAQLV